MGRVVGIRGAVAVEKNTRECILASSKELLLKIILENHIKEEDVASIIFTATKDLNAAFPAEAARMLGWTESALLDALELDIEKSMPRVIRVLLHVNVPQDFKACHVYLGEAAKLRPDLQK